MGHGAKDVGNETFCPKKTAYMVLLETGIGHSRQHFCCSGATDLQYFPNRGVFCLQILLPSRLRLPVKKAVMLEKVLF